MGGFSSISYYYYYVLDAANAVVRNYTIGPKSHLHWLSF